MSEALWAYDSAEPFYMYTGDDERTNDDNFVNIAEFTEINAVSILQPIYTAYTSL